MACRKINKVKIQKALENTEKWIKGAEKRGAKETFRMGNDIGFTILWCEKRNAIKYREMLKYEFVLELNQNPELKELYQAI